MKSRLIGIALFAALLTLAPLAAAAADEEKTPSGTEPTRPDDAAWVEDCPPDMVCAADDGTTRGPADCEYCRDHQEQDCVDCVGSPMPTDDNTTWGTDCPPGVYCMADGAGEDPDDAGWVDCGGEVCAYDDEPVVSSDDVEEAPFASLVLLAPLALVGVAFALALRK